MSEQLLFFLGNRNPSISQTITSGGAAVNINGATVTFRMRAVGSSALIIDALATNLDDGTPALRGSVRYDWSAADIAAITGGQYLVWWVVTSGGKTQDMNEALIEWRAHSNSHMYVELAQLKSSSELANMTFADQDYLSAISTASRTIDDLCSPKPYGGIHRRFYADDDAQQVRYYSPFDRLSLAIDDLITITSLKTDPSGMGAYDFVWTPNDYVLSPINAALEGRPWERISVHPRSFWPFPIEFPRSVQVTGKFGWAATPQGIKEATALLAARLVKRRREAPLGIVGSHDGVAMQIARNDPDIPGLIRPFVRGGRGLG